MSGSIKVTVSPSWNRWVNGFNTIEREAQNAARTEFQQAGEVFFARSQQFVHVLSGDLLASGSIEIVATGGEVVARLTYDTDYAIYENARGGSHAFIDRAWEATEQTFADALPGAWSKVVSSWR